VEAAEINLRIRRKAGGSLASPPFWTGIADQTIIVTV
jgi:hypothetical protein